MPHSGPNILLFLSWSSSLCSLDFCTLISSLLGQNIFLNALLPNTFSLCPSFSVLDQVSQSHKARKIIFQLTLIFMLLDSKRENERFKYRGVAGFPRDILSLLLISSWTWFRFIWIVCSNCWRLIIYVYHKTCWISMGDLEPVIDWGWRLFEIGANRIVCACRNIML
jgi:hypothetical protein